MGGQTTTENEIAVNKLTILFAWFFPVRYKLYLMNSIVFPDDVGSNLLSKKVIKITFITQSTGKLSLV